jgi:urease accessory protein
MSATAQLLQQRSFGQLKLRMELAGPQLIREVGAAKLRIPRGSHEAIFINTGGGLAGGDQFEYEFSCGESSKLTLTSQAAERVYGSLGPPAVLNTQFVADANSALLWLPQETILYDGASLQRQFTALLSKSSKFLAVEPVVLGRTEMAEKISRIHLKDRWRVKRDDALIHADDFLIGPDLPNSKATLGSAKAFATVIYIAEDAELRLNLVRAALNANDGASAWNGKLIARIIAADGFLLRKTLIPVIDALAGGMALPKIWTA